VNVEGLGRAEPVHVPDLLDQLLAREHDAGALHQGSQQLELLAREVERLASEGGDPAGLVEPHARDLDRRARRHGGRLRPAQDRAHPSHDLSRGEGLDDVVIRSELEARDPVGLLAAGGEHDDRRARAAAQLAADVEAGAIREADVEQDQVG
jgi:hypothetical protein